VPFGWIKEHESHSAEDIFNRFKHLSLTDQDYYLVLAENKTKTTHIQRKLASKAKRRCSEAGRREADVVHVASIYTTKTFGKGLFLFTSRFDHSCIPNCTVRELGGGSQGMRVVKNLDVRVGDELEVDYLDEKDVEKLRATLRYHYGFECKCLGGCEQLIYWPPRPSEPLWLLLELRIHGICL
jgi:hypothetical protein